MSEGFADFVTARSPRLLRTAYLLTQDWPAAEDLLQTALAKAWGAWKRLDGDPEPYVRRILVNTYSSWWQRRWRGEQATAELPESTSDDQHAAIDERDRVWRALRRLPRRQRAVLVLRYFEDLPEAQIADLLGIAPGTVKSQAAKALAKLRMDQTLLPEPAMPPTPAARLAQVERKIAQRRRRAIAVGAAGAVVLLLILFAGYRIIAAHRPIPPQPPVTTPSPSYINGFPEYSDGYHVVATKTLPAGAQSMDLTWTPIGTDVAFFADCAVASPKVEIEIQYEVADAPTGSFMCVGPVFTAEFPRLRPGDPAVSRMTFSAIEVTYDERGERVIKPVPLPAQGTYRVAIGEAAEYDGYQFPARPAQLKPLPPTNCLDVRGDPANPLRSGSAQVEWHNVIRLDVYSQTPGMLHFALNGVPVMTETWWDYERAGHIRSWDTAGGRWANVPRLGVSAVDAPTLVTLTVTPEKVTGGWLVAISYRDRDNHVVMEVDCAR